MHRISNPRDVEEADGPPSAPSTVARSTREQDPLRASSNAWFVGVLVAGYGLLLVGTTSAEWLSLGGPGSHLGPPSIIQAFTLRIVACATRALAFPLRRRHADRHRRRDKSRPVARANSGVRGIRFPTSDRARGRTLCDLLHVPLVLCARGRGLQPPNHSSLDGQFHGRGRGAQRHPSSVGHRPVRPPVLHRVQFWLGESRTRGRYLCPVGPP